MGELSSSIYQVSLVGRFVLPDNRYEKLGWHPTPEINNWVRRVSKKSGLKMSDVLTRMATEYIANHDPVYYETHLAPQTRTGSGMTYD